MAKGKSRNETSTTGKTRGMKRRRFLAGAAAAVTVSPVVMSKWSEALAQAGRDGGITEWRVAENPQIAQVQPGCGCGCSCGCGCG